MLSVYFKIFNYLRIMNGCLGKDMDVTIISKAAFLTLNRPRRLTQSALPDIWCAECTLRPRWSSLLSAKLCSLPEVCAIVPQLCPCSQAANWRRV